MPQRLEGWSKRLIHGATAAVVGSARALIDRDLRSVFSKNAKLLMVMSLVLVLVVYAVMLPLEWISSFFFSHETIDSTIRAFRHGAGSTVPFLLITFCRYVNVHMFENVFFAALATRDATLAKQIRKKKAIYWDWEYVRHLLHFNLRQAGFGLLAYLATPILGIFIPLVRFGYRIRRMEVVFWLPIFLAFCIPMTRTTALELVHLWVDSRSIIRELFDPIIARLKTAREDAAKHLEAKTDIEIKTRLERDWHRGRSDAARLGFAIVFGYLLQIPFLGPFTWFLGFVSAGLFAPELIDLHVFTVAKKA